jgi:hypothetical protein
MAVYRRPRRGSTCDRARLGARLRIRLRPERHRSPADKAQAPWTNGQVERMNRTIKDATVKRYFYETHDPASPPAKLRRRLQLRQTPQNPQRPHPIRIRLQSLDFRTSQIQTQSAPANAGTKHPLDACVLCALGRREAPGGPRWKLSSKASGSKSPQLHQEVLANRRDFLRHGIARHFRSLPRQGPVSVPVRRFSGATPDTSHRIPPPSESAAVNR